MTQLLFVAAFNIAGFFLLWFLLRARIRRYLELENLLSGVREESRALVMELNETADRNVSLLEDRISVLKALLEELDRRMGVARREFEKRDVERDVYSRLASRRPIVPPPPSEGMDAIRPNRETTKETPPPTTLFRQASC
jgi:hypothetical protein